MALDDKQIKAIQEASGHSVFGSSSLPRIVQCPASVGMELKAGIQPSSPYALKGVELHETTDKAIRSENPHKYLYSLPLSIEDTAYVLDAVQYVFDIAAKHEGDHLVIMAPDADGKYSMVEARSLVAEGKIVMMLEVGGSLASYGLPESYGTSNVLIMSLKRTDSIDHKFGHGVAVYAEKNYQLVAYLAMAVPFTQNPDPEHELYVHINQPTKQIFDEWRVGWDVLYQMILGDVTDAISKARSDDPPFSPSVKACRFCAANKNCKERYNTLMGQAKLIRAMANNPSEVSNDKWASFLEAAESLKTAISQIERHAVTEIQKGHDFPGFKLISGRSTRRFVDDEAAKQFMADRLGKKAFKPQEFISLAQAEKVDKDLKKDERWQELIHKPEGKPKLVLASHKGEALTYGVTGLMQQIASSERS